MRLNFLGEWISIPWTENNNQLKWNAQQNEINGQPFRAIKSRIATDKSRPLPFIGKTFKVLISWYVYFNGLCFVGLLGFPGYPAAH